MSRWVFVFHLFIGVVLAAPASPFGRYIGVLRHEALKRDQLAKLDFIASREENNVLVLKAVLTLHMGDFKSGEYIGYHFDNVRFNLLSQAFVFDQADQPITLKVSKFTGDEFVGEFRSAHSGEISQIILNKDKLPELKYPIFQPVWGEYYGVCQSKALGRPTPTTVQLYPYRANEGASQVGNPFRAYKIAGFLGENQGTQCFSGQQSMCVWGNITSGSFNFYKNNLLIFNNYKNLNCSQTPNGLQCEGCEELKRVSSETSGEKVLTPPAAKSELGDITQSGPALVDEVESIQGDYVGYVHHEYLNVYQPGSINILTYQAPDSTGGTPSLRMSAIGSLSFGEDNSIESLSYRFDERDYPNPLAAPQFTFSQPGSDLDAIIQVTNLGKGWVKGVWYSRLFGRVGEFVFRKGTRPELPATAVKMEAVSGYYQSSLWEIQLQVGATVAGQDNVNPFSPLTFGGWGIIPNITAKKHIFGGSYDFYTGRIGLEDEDKKPMQIGNRFSRRRLALKKMTTAVTSPLPKHEPAPFRLWEGSEP